MEIVGKKTTAAIGLGSPYNKNEFKNEANSNNDSVSKLTRVNDNPNTSGICPLCCNKGVFEFRPRYPDELMIIVKELELETNKISILTCPFCARRFRQNCIQEANDEYQIEIKEEYESQGLCSSFSDSQLAQGLKTFILSINFY